MLRTYEAWKTRQAAGELQFTYVGKQTPEHIGRECHVIKRVCPRIELDAFEVGGTASTDPKAVAAEGHTEVTIYIDVERLAPGGQRVVPTEPDGTRVGLRVLLPRRANSTELPARRVHHGRAEK